MVGSVLLLLLVLICMWGSQAELFCACIELCATQRPDDAAWVQQFSMAMARQVFTSSATMWSQLPEERRAALREQVGSATAHK